MLFAGFSFHVKLVLSIAPFLQTMANYLSVLEVCFHVSGVFFICIFYCLFWLHCCLSKFWFTGNGAKGHLRWISPLLITPILQRIHRIIVGIHFRLNNVVDLFQETSMRCKSGSKTQYKVFLKKIKISESICRSIF